MKLADHPLLRVIQELKKSAPLKFDWLDFEKKLGLTVLLSRSENRPRSYISSKASVLCALATDISSIHPPTCYPIETT